jgi:uncharacterized membrane protein YcaP (DUF421 family)
MKTKEKFYLDVLTEYYQRFDVLMIKNEYHRKILNRQPKTRIENGRLMFLIDLYVISN